MKPTTSHLLWLARLSFDQKGRHAFKVRICHPVTGHFVDIEGHIALELSDRQEIVYSLTFFDPESYSSQTVDQHDHPLGRPVVSHSQTYHWLNIADVDYGFDSADHQIAAAVLKALMQF